uniref:Uncharacterized protein n=1 Tax=Glypta fumiferanae TaxID=389681 RepID=A0A0F6Q772_9HYME|nr:hypothetical protein [Glypta fumiferanae]
MYTANHTLQDPIKVALKRASSLKKNPPDREVCISISVRLSISFHRYVYMQLQVRTVFTHIHMYTCTNAKMWLLVEAMQKTTRRTRAFHDTLCINVWAIPFKIDTFPAKKYSTNKMPFFCTPPSIL